MSKTKSSEPAEAFLPSHLLHSPNSELLLEDFVRREWLARELGLSPRTISRWESLRKGPPRIAIGRTILYNIESVRAWLRSREQQVPSPKRSRRFPGKPKVKERDG